MFGLPRAGRGFPVRGRRGQPSVVWGHRRLAGGVGKDRRGVASATPSSTSQQREVQRQSGSLAAPPRRLIGPGRVPATGGQHVAVTAETNL
jgi:hypothetical protein